MAALHRKFIRRADERQARELRDLRRYGLREAGCRIDSGTYGRPSEGKAMDPPERVFNPSQIIREHALIARPFLSKRERRRILHVRAADLDDVVPLSGFR